MVLQTERLIVRRWQASDHEPFARMNADPRVMRFMPGVLSEAESNALVSRIEAHFEQHGFGVYALEHGGEFIGFTGLWVPTFEAEFTPCVEIAWRLRPEFQNRGFATEAARAVIRHAFNDPPWLKEVVAFTVPANEPSRRVMEKIGMIYVSEFDHPQLAEGHPLRRHVLYRILNPDR